MQVQITVAGGKITKSEGALPQGGDSIAQNALPQLNQEVLTAQSADIQAVSGATYTSDGYISSLQKAVDQAAENYRITRNKYDNALATTTDLLDADVSQLQARMNYEFARADAMTAYSKLMETAGVLQEKISQ